METSVTNWPSRIAVRFLTALYERERSKYQLTAPAEAHPSSRPAKIAINVSVVGIFLSHVNPLSFDHRKWCSLNWSLVQV